MEHESEGYTTSERCPRNNTHEVKELVKENKYWNWDNRVAEIVLLYTAQIIQKILKV